MEGALEMKAGRQGVKGVRRVDEQQPNDPPGKGNNKRTHQGSQKQTGRYLAFRRCERICSTRGGVVVLNSYVASRSIG